MSQKSDLLDLEPTLLLSPILSKCWYYLSSSFSEIIVRGEWGGGGGGAPFHRFFIYILPMASCYARRRSKRRARAELVRQVATILVATAVLASASKGRKKSHGVRIGRI